MVKTVSSLTLCMLLAASFAFAGDQTTLSTDEIMSFVKGKRLTAQRAERGVRIRFGEDGMLSIQDGHAVESGKWSAADNKLCLTVPKWNYEGCGKVVNSEGAIKLLTPAEEKEYLAFNK